MQVFIDDRGRYKTNTGYGNLSRNFGKALSGIGIDVIYSPIESMKWHDQLSEITRDSFENSVNYGKWENAEIALTVSPPCSKIVKDMPNVIYTQNALTGIRPAWKEVLPLYDAIVVPGQFDLNYFKELNPHVETCPQLVDTRIFVNRPKWREEGDEKFTFIFVGSFSYRKGVDILLEAFCEFSRLDNNSSKLVLVCPGAKNMNFLLNILRKHNPSAHVEILIEDITQDWVCRHINRSDVFITLSRGEGWCMPLFESILTQKPCIVPNSTAMGECAPDVCSVIKMPVTETLVSEVDTPFGQLFRENYQNDNTASYDVSVINAVRSMKEMKDTYSDRYQGIKEAREFVINNYSFDVVGKRLKSILSSVLDYDQSV